MRTPMFSPHPQCRLMAALSRLMHRELQTTRAKGSGVALLQAPPGSAVMASANRRARALELFTSFRCLGHMILDRHAFLPVTCCRLCAARRMQTLLTTGMQTITNVSLG